ncbi:hypothetical protein NQ317_005563 [Molorchus minor]|uniref:Uncharacterized protein n=1 Tax=Molorchus minor TaxID=1323400 RepID=A0ABQ9IWC6_9CUCU|nr:hypothetical protein NQ317_005563 [Molorchus minor]
MSFYLKPPRGQINFHQLEECARQRLMCYDKICNNDTLLEISSFECLVEDSSLDRTGHFIFRLSAYFNSRFREVFLQNEAKLLLLRLNCYKEADLKYFLKKILRQIKDILEENEADDKILEVCIWFFKICQQMLKKEYLAYIFNESHKADINNNYILKVPFHVCPSLIRNRETGKTYFLSIYDSYLKLALDAMKYSRNVENTLYDDRIIDILKFIKSHYFKKIFLTLTLTLNLT